MEYIKGGKLVLNGKYNEQELEDMLLKALELIVNKRVDFFEEIIKMQDYEDYDSNYSYLEDRFFLSESEWNLLKEISY